MEGYILDYIKKEIDDLKKKFKTSHPFELCSALNINLTKMELHPEINGLYQYEMKNKFIYLNSLLPFREQLITCADEIGHAKLHERMNCTYIRNHTLYNKNKIERAANIFAAYLIIPDELLAFHGQTIYELAAELDVPVELLRLRLYSSKIFDC